MIEESNPLVREVGGLDRVGYPTSASASPLTSSLKVEHVGESDQAMPAAGQVL